MVHLHPDGESALGSYGSLLGLLFFITFISDLPSVNIIALYADDCKSSRIIDSNEDLELLQQDLGNLKRWSTLNGVELSAKLCKLLESSNHSSHLFH